MFFRPYSSFDEDDMNKIEDGLYLGNLEAARNKNVLEREGITHVLGLLDTFRYYDKFDGIIYHTIELPDYQSQNILQYVPEALSFISEALNSGRILVHCAAGVSRSASIVISYMMVKHSWSFQSAFDYVRSKRSCIWPNDGFQSQIQSIDVNDYKKYLR
jgi:protein-tyrosine phosphatase